MSLLDLWRAYKAAKPVIDRVKPWLDKPWVKSILGFLAGLFKSAPEKPGEKVYRRDDPDRPRDATDDLKSENQPNV